MKYIFSLLTALLLASALVACSQSQQPKQPAPIDEPDKPAQNPEDSLVARFGDTDIQQAAQNNVAAAVTLASALKDRAPAATTVPFALDKNPSAGAFAKADGNVCYIRKKTSLAKPFQLFVFDQKSQQGKLILESVNEMQSVACNATADTFLLSHRSNANEDFELFLLDSKNDTIEQLTNNGVDDINVSMSDDMSVLAWQAPHNGVAATFVKRGDAVSVLESQVARVEPTVSANGTFITFVEQAPQQAAAVMRFNLSNNTLTTVFSASPAMRSLRHPSITNDGQMLAFAVLEDDANSQRNPIIIHDLNTNQQRRIEDTPLAANAKARIKHPHLTHNGAWVSVIVEESLVVFQTQTGATRASTGNEDTISRFAPFWAFHPEQATEATVIEGDATISAPIDTPTILRGGTITIAQSSIWSAPVTIEQGTTIIIKPSRSIVLRAPLTVQQGVTFRANGRSQIRVDASGSINAQGTAENKIVFTATSQRKGFWQGIIFRGSGAEGVEPSTLRHVDISFAVNNITLNDASNRTLSIEDSIMHNASGSGLLVTCRQNMPATLELKRNRFENNGNHGYRNSCFRQGFTLKTFERNSFVNNRTDAAINAQHMGVVAGGFIGEDVVQVSGRTTNIDQTITPLERNASELQSAGLTTAALDTPLRFQINSLTVNSKLTIQGHVHFICSRAITVAGNEAALVALGKPDKPIVFEARSERKGWDGLSLSNTNAANVNRLEHVIISHARVNISVGDNSTTTLNHVQLVDASLHALGREHRITAATLDIQNTTFARSGRGALDLQSDKITIRNFNNNTFSESNDQAPTIHPNLLAAVVNGATFDKQRIDVSGRLTQAQVVRPKVTPFEIRAGVLEILNNGVLDIGAGIVIHITGTRGFVEIERGGKLKAVGTAAQPIIFKGSRASWEGIHFEHASHGSNQEQRLEHVDISGGTKGISARGSINLSLNHVTIHNVANSAFIHSRISGVGETYIFNISNSRFADAKLGFKLPSSQAQLITFDNNVFRNNSQDAHIGISLVDPFVNTSDFETAIFVSGKDVKRPLNISPKEPVILKDKATPSTSNIVASGSQSTYIFHEDVTIGPGVTFITNGRRTECCTVARVSSIDFLKNVTINGTTEAPVIFATEGTRRDYWQGLIFRGANAQTINMKHLEVFHANIAIDFQAGTGSSLALEQSSIHDNATIGVCNRPKAAPETTNLSISNVDFRNNGPTGNEHTGPGPGRKCP